MGNRAIITLEDGQGRQHPVATYVHWNGGPESVLAFLTYTWDSYPRGREDIFTFHARLSQVIGNFFPDGLSLYGYPLDRADAVAHGCDNGRFHARIDGTGVTLLNRDESCTQNARRHAYWSGTRSIFDEIRAAMPQPAADDRPPPATPAGRDIESILSAIARETLGLDDLLTRNRDCLDFHDLPVWKIRHALSRAYQQGRNAAHLPTTRKG